VSVIAEEFCGSPNSSALSVARAASDLAFSWLLPP
jgi:hypothetical protein